MANRLDNQDRTALLRIRENLMRDHDRLLDAPTEPVAMVKQSDVASAFSRAIKSLEEVLREAGGVRFTK